MCDEDPFEMFARMIDKTPEVNREGVQAFVNLAATQLCLEELREEDADWREAIISPEGCADAPTLRAILSAAATRGFVPDEDEETQKEFARMLAEGFTILWPLRDSGPTRKDHQ